MAATKRMKRALVSVFHKDGLDEILKKLHSEGVSFVSTGGTQSFIESLGLPCDAVEDLTSYPSILGGRRFIRRCSVVSWLAARTRMTRNN
mgnify:CR=1 FL=1